MRSERGAVAVIVATLLGSGALIAVIALAFDFGRVYLEQQVLKDGGSSAALALASACANQLPACQDQASAEALVQTFLDSNSPDGESGLLELCGSAPLNACVIVSTKQSACLEYTGAQNLVRVIASARESGIDSLGLFFTPQESIELAQCSQAEWSGGSEFINFETELDIGFPLCDYLPSQAPVVWFQFQNGGNTPNIPRERSCTLNLGGQPTTFTDVANGMAGIDIPVGKCTDPVGIVTGDVLGLGDTNFKNLCGKEIDAYLDEAILNQTELDVAALGIFDRQSSNNIDFTVTAAAKIRILGYRFTNSNFGGTEPSGGWENYPTGVPASENCQNSRPCIFGYYVNEPVLASDQVLARLIFD